MGPTWQSIVPELVPRAELKSAVALNSLGINIARAIGPAAGGLLLASFGAALTYGVDVLSYVFVIAALLWWRRPAAADERAVRALPRRLPRRPALHARQPRAARGAAARGGVLRCSRVRSGRCCRWWRARCWAAAPASTASCSAPSAPAPSAARW